MQQRLFWFIEWLLFSLAIRFEDYVDYHEAHEPTHERQTVDVGPFTLGVYYCTVLDHESAHIAVNVGNYTIGYRTVITVIDEKPIEEAGAYLERYDVWRRPLSQTAKEALCGLIPGPLQWLSFGVVVLVFIALWRRYRR